MISLKEQDVVRINRPDRLLHPFVERDQPDVLRVGGFVQRIVPRHPGVILVMLYRVSNHRDKEDGYGSHGRAAPR